MLTATMMMMVVMYNIANICPTEASKMVQYIIRIKCVDFECRHRPAERLKRQQKQTKTHEKPCDENLIWYSLSNKFFFVCCFENSLNLSKRVGVRQTYGQIGGL